MTLINKKLFYICIPILLLVCLFFYTKKEGIEGNFNRTFITDAAIKPIDTAYIGGDIDGICLDGDNLWLNKRNFIVQYDKNLQRKRIIDGADSLSTTLKNSPIVSISASNDSLFYNRANIKQINLVDLKNNGAKTSYPVKFSISYFIKSNGVSFLTQESTLGNANAQIHYINPLNKAEFINKNVFANSKGSCMRYSGSFLSTPDHTNFFFVSFHDDHIFCLDAEGKLKYSFKGIDFQNQELKIIEEGSKFFLSPESSVLRSGAFADQYNLFVSSYVRNTKQTKKDFDQNLTIDVYNVKNGHYKYSFYLPNQFGHKASDFALSANHVLYALYGSKIVLLDLSKLPVNEK